MPATSRNSRATSAIRWRRSPTAGLPASDRAFLVAVKRMGSLDMLSREFAREHSERLWKQLVICSDADVDRSKTSLLNAETLIVFALAAAAAAAVKVPELFGKHIVVDGDMGRFYKRMPASSRLCRSQFISDGSAD